MTELELQIKMIELLIQKDEYEQGCSISTFEKATGENRKSIKKIIDNLKRANMISSDWCIDYDGMLNGRAYFLTDRATDWSIREWLQELKKIKVGTL